MAAHTLAAGAGRGQSRESRTRLTKRSAPINDCIGRPARGRGARGAANAMKGYRHPACEPFSQPGRPRNGSSKKGIARRAACRRSHVRPTRPVVSRIKPSPSSATICRQLLPSALMNAMWSMPLQGPSPLEVAIWLHHGALATGRPVLARSMRGANDPVPADGLEQRSLEHAPRTWLNAAALVARHVAAVGDRWFQVREWIFDRAS